MGHPAPRRSNLDWPKARAAVIVAADNLHPSGSTAPWTTISQQPPVPRLQLSPLAKINQQLEPNSLQVSHSRKNFRLAFPIRARSFGSSVKNLVFFYISQSPIL